MRRIKEGDGRGGGKTPHVFGPVPSRRLGLSLGIDLIPPKTCSYNCLYCELGPTTRRTLTEAASLSADEVVQEAAIRLSQSRPDVLTLAGSGEPTLYADLGVVIERLKTMTDIPVALLTNGSLFFREAVRRRVMKADMILPTLTSAFEETFRRIHRPHPDLTLDLVLSGLRALREEYRGSLWLEVVFLRGLNDSEQELLGLRRVIQSLAPDKVQLNTVVRPPSDSRAVPLDTQALEEIKNFLGERAEILLDFPFEGKGHRGGSPETELVKMLRRRPMRPVDAAEVLGLTLEEARDLLDNLCRQGTVRELRQSGQTYYARREDDAK